MPASSALGARPIVRYWTSSGTALVPHALLRPDRNLQDAVVLIGEQVIGFFDLIERKVMRDKGAGIHPPALHHRHQAPHYGNFGKTRDEEIISLLTQAGSGWKAALPE